MMNPQTNFNPQAGLYMAHQEQYRAKSDQELLEQLSALAAYGNITPPSMMLLAELHLRAQQAFSKTFVPTKEVHGDSYLYTSIYKDGLMTHFFVADKEVKEKIDNIINETKGGLAGDNSKALIDLGDVFDVVTVNERGVPIGESKKRGFINLYGGGGFNKQPLHVSKTLPLAVFELSFMPSDSFNQGMFNELLMTAIQMATDDKELLSRVDHYLRSYNALLEYKKSTDSVISEPGQFRLIPITTQVHFFPVDHHQPVKFISALYSDRDQRFIDRNQHPRLFVNPILNYNHNTYGGGLGGFGGMGRPGF